VREAVSGCFSHIRTSDAANVRSQRRRIRTFDPYTTILAHW
jgi:hypothetical protein